MTEMEKVVQKLEEVIAEAVYPVRPLKFMMPLKLAEDALALLKAQEPVEPKWRNGYAYCGQCGYKLHWIVEQNNFCPNCGRAVKWE